MAIANSDGSIILTTHVDTSGAEMATKSLRSQAMKLAAEYRKAGMSQSEAQKRAYKELGVTIKETKKAKKATKEYGEEAEKSGSKAKKYFSILIRDLKYISETALKAAASIGAVAGAPIVKSFSFLAKGLLSIGKTALKVSAAISAVAGAAIVALTKQAVSAYADYEQLVGGVDTLFKNSSQKLQDYASEAYRTAGVSANEFMQQVTSFSASLISSLGGDTDKAADVANMALIDMADNANKMGTAMESIQFAYQGFAKQQYMLLDNLKLGYGGTKTEMERLLADAEAITGVKYDISNLADVYNAIHVIQQELNITGTTALEAEKTITGSLNSTKAAWQDLVTAIGRGDGIGQAIDNFMQSLSNFISNTVPVVRKAMTSIGKVIAQVAPQLIQMLAQTIISAIPALIEAIYNSVVGLVKGIVDGVKALFTGAKLEKSVTVKTDTKSIDATTESVEALGEATEETAEKASGATASFDELNIINAKDESKTDSGSPSIGGLPTITQPVEIQPQIAEKSKFQKTLTSFFSQIKNLMKPVINFFGELIDVTAEWATTLDFSKVNKSFDKLGKSMGNMFKTLENSFKSIYIVAILPLTEWLITDFYPAWVDLLAAGIDLISIAVGVLISAFVALLDTISPLTTFLSEVMLSVMGLVEEIFSRTGDMIIAKGDKINSIFTAFGDILVALQPIFEVVFFVLHNLVVMFGDVFVSTFGGLIDMLSGFMDFLAGVFTADWERAWGGIKDIFVGVWDAIKGVLVGFWSFIKGIFTPIVNWIKTYVCEPVAGFFQNVWDVICAGAKAFVNFFVGLLNGLIGCFEAFVNFFVKAINTVISAINKISVKVPDWVPGIGGNKFGFDLKKVSEAKLGRIPELAEGAVIPPNNRFLAVLGDQKSGTNIEAPLATIKQALAEVMREYGGGGNQPIIVEIDGREVFRAVKNAEMRYGSQIMIGGAY